MRKAKVPARGIQVEEEEEATTGEMFGCAVLKKAHVMLPKHTYWWNEGLLAHEKQQRYKRHNKCGAFVFNQMWRSGQFVLSQYRSNIATTKSHSNCACSQVMEAKARIRTAGTRTLTCLHTSLRHNCRMYLKIQIAKSFFRKIL
jgi:hypothetical protein